MLECMRVLVETPGWTPSTALIFLFNNAEESLQDGSHLYSTQHPTAPTFVIRLTRLQFIIQRIIPPAFEVFSI